MKKNRGFSLLELLIVVAIILIIATIAIPSLLRSRQSANESAAVANMRNLNSAQVSYSTSTGGIYGPLSVLVAGKLIDPRYDTGNFTGFRYTLDLSTDGRDFTAYATAISPNTSRYDYYSVPDFVVRYSTNTARAPLGKAGTAVQ